MYTYNVEMDIGTHTKTRRGLEIFLACFIKPSALQRSSISLTFLDELFDEMLMNYWYELSLIIQQTVGGFTLHEQTEILNLTITFYNSQYYEVLNKSTGTI